MQASDILFRCSSLGKIKAGPREKAGTIAPGVCTHLVDIFVSAVYGRREEAEGKMLEKGNQREEDSLTLLSRVHKNFYRKNDVRLSNKYITGECDIFIGESIENATETIDTKTSWSANTFFRASHADLEEKYEEQGHGYMWLTGAKKHTVAYCLVNGTAQAIMDEDPAYLGETNDANRRFEPVSPCLATEHCRSTQSRRPMPRSASGRGSPQRPASAKHHRGRRHTRP